MTYIHDNHHIDKVLPLMNKRWGGGGDLMPGVKAKQKLRWVDYSLIPRPSRPSVST